MKVGVGVGVDRGDELGDSISDNGVEEALVELTLRDMTGDGGIKTFEEAVNELEMLILKATRDAIEVKVLEEIRVGTGITVELEKTVCSVLDVAKIIESSCEVYGNIISSLDPNPDPAEFHSLSLISHCQTPVYTYS